MKIFLINLDRMPERLARMKETFAKQNLTFQRIPAIDGSKIEENFYNEVVQNQIFPRPLGRGEIGCFLSHLQALKHVAAGSDSYAAIFEDDVILSCYAHYFLSTEDWIPEDADIIRLEPFRKRLWLGPVKAVLTTTILPDFAFPDVQISLLKSSCVLTGGYIISKKAASWLLEELQMISAPFDHILYDLDYPIAHKLQRYQLNPAIVKQAGLADSTLESERCGLKLKKSLMQILRREIWRIYCQGWQKLQELKINYCTKDRWKKINFLDKVD